MKHMKRTLLMVATASFGLKLLVASWAVARDPTPFETSDSKSYIWPADALLTHGTYAVSPQDPGTPATLRTPGYPLFIAAVYGLAGRYTAAVVLAQIVLSMGTLVLVCSLASELWDRHIGQLAALLLALDITSFVYSLWLLTETLFTFLLTAALVCGVRFRRSAPQLRWCALFGLAFTASVLVRPIAYYLIGPLALWVILVCVQQLAGLRRSAAAVIAFVIPFVLFVGGWQLRNELRTGVPVLSRVAGINMLFFRGAAVVALRDGVSLQEARHRLGYKRYIEVYPEARALSPEELSQRWQRQGLALIRAHPVLFARTHLRPLATILLGTPEHSLMALLDFPVPATGPLGDLLRLDPGSYVERWIVQHPLSWSAFVLLMVYLLGLYLGTVLAWIHLFRARRFSLEHGVLVLVFLYLLLISAGPEAYSRFRVPLAPFLCIYGAAGLTLVWTRLRGDGR